MAQFFQNVWAWVVSKADLISGLFSLPNFIAFVANVIAMIKLLRSVRSNGKALLDGKVLQTLESNKKEIAELKAQNKELKHDIEDLKVQIGDLTDLMTQSVAKLNAVLEVQEIAYNASSLPQETRIAIRNCTAAGKFAESKAHLAVVEEVASLKAQIKVAMDASERTEERIKKLTNTVETPAKPVTKPKAEGVRYD